MVDSLAAFALNIARWSNLDTKPILEICNIILDYT